MGDKTFKLLRSGSLVRGLFCVLAIVYVGVFFLAGHASATSLIGDTIWMEQRYPTFDTLYGGPYYRVVTADASDSFPSGAVSFNVNAMSLTITAVMDYPVGGTFNGAVFGDLDFTPGANLVGLTLESSTIPGFDLSKTGILSDKSFWVDFAGLTVSVSQNESATLGFVTTPVPLPPALLLFGPGLVGIAAFRRRFKK